MKGLKLLLLSFCVAFAACSVQSPSVQVSDKGTKWSWDKGTIVVETPERPAGQTSVIGLTAPKIEAVRVGFVGLGMRCGTFYLYSRRGDCGSLRLRTGTCREVPALFEESFHA